MKTASAKSKGRRHQQWLRDLIYAMFVELESNDVQSRSMGAQGEDLILSPAALRLFPYSVECKHHKAFAIYSVYKQAVDNCRSGMPLAVIKANHERPLAIVDAEYFVRLHKFIPQDAYAKVNEAMKGVKRG